MSIFEYNYFDSPLKVGDYNPHMEKCVFCNNKMQKFPIEDYWDVNLDEIDKFHKANKNDYIKEQGMNVVHWQLNLDGYSSEVWFNHCDKCGWWRIQKDVSVSGKHWQIWQFFYGAAGILKKLDLSDIKTPVDEISKYLFVKYESRFKIHPRLFEDVTGEVFKNIGYDVVVTGYSNDGGIDVILEKETKQIGVQVKRYKNKIKVDQIRELTGALFLGDLPQGIFVTTSDFQKGVYKTVKKSLDRGIPIELINSKRFYEILNLTTKTVLDSKNIRNNMERVINSKLYSYNWENPMNSL